MVKRVVSPERWIDRWERALDACDSIGGSTDELIVRGPATERAVKNVEKNFGLTLPAAFRQVLTQFSAEVEFRWFLPKRFELPDALRGIFSGECRWSLDRLSAIEDSRRQWVEGCFPNVEDEYDRVWHNKLAFLDVKNGDMLALDLALSPSPVVYLSHDGDDTHGYRLGADFADFIDRWTLLGCPGAEDWQMMPFLDSPTALLDPDGANAALWRTVFGLRFAE